MTNSENNNSLVYWTFALASKIRSSAEGASTPSSSPDSSHSRDLRLQIARKQHSASQFPPVMFVAAPADDTGGSTIARYIGSRVLSSRGCTPPSIITAARGGK
ncbi:hypothetical protein [Kamptonema animale]|uniref:hypothetical protein n=1 Tax=Kamptonema animale TaxID=92934 RepID=UPI00232C84DA|nr:hypothetical protein [Kamptonema animale]